MAMDPSINIPTALLRKATHEMHVEADAVGTLDDFYERYEGWFRRAGWWNALVLGWTHALGRPDFDWFTLSSYDVEDTRILIEHLQGVWWSDNPPPPELVARVVLTDESMASWNKRVDEGRDLPPSW